MVGFRLVEGHHDSASVGTSFYVGTHNTEIEAGTADEKQMNNLARL